MEKVTVALGKRAYDIWIGPDALELLGPGKGKTLLATDSNVERLWGASVRARLKVTEKFVFPAGEEAKNIGTAMELCSLAARRRFDRGGRFLALGGGVTGDLTGFAAAVYMRGVEFVQIPTSLLAMVDSSVGGKTAVDIPEGKNLVGAFHQPAQVLIDPRFLATLPKEELRNGLAEAVKTAVILDPKFFDYLESQGASLLENPDFEHVYPEIIRRCCELKAGVVAGDECEQGRRAILNYGHTFGHAVELLSNFSVPHGAAVAVGMVVAGELNRKLERWSRIDMLRQKVLLAALGLPTALPSEFAPAAVLEAMRADKKNAGGAIRVVLPKKIGDAEMVAGVPEKLLLEVLEECHD